MKLTKEQIEQRNEELCRQHQEYFARPDPISKMAAEKIQGEIFGLQWVLDHWEEGYKQEDNA